MLAFSAAYNMWPVSPDAVASSSCTGCGCAYAELKRREFCSAARPRGFLAGVQRNRRCLSSNSSMVSRSAAP
jgi:hypothetical protein